MVGFDGKPVEDKERLFWNTKGVASLQATRGSNVGDSMRISTATLVCSAAFAFLLPVGAAAQTYAERIVTGFIYPMFGTYAPGDASRLFVGRIWFGRIEIVDLNSRTVLPDPFLVIEDLPSPLGVEQGLLGLTFDPDYATNGYFYVNYTGADNSINVVRYRVLGDPAISNVADPSSAHQILNVPKGSVYWHNAGWIDFGPNDGYLYINIGDPGSRQAQDITDNLHGKILRIDVRGDEFPDDPMRNYAIPATNPFVGKEGDDEIWAYGFRNPWRASFDRQTGDLWINDTGEATREEVNYQPAHSGGGENYGWPRREGTTSTPPPYGSPPSPEYIEPVYDYAHDEPDPLFRGNVIAASGFYRGPVDAFYGHYFFTDNGSRNIWKLDPDAVDPRASVTNVNNLLLPDAGIISRLPAFGEDAVGNFYLMSFVNATNNGDIFLVTTASKRIVWNGDDASAGMAGDGMAWGDANNWTREGVPDSGFVAEDSVVFAAGSSQQVVALGAERTVAAVTFQAPRRLQGHTLRVLSGNIFVDGGVEATIDATLSAESPNHSIRKLGAGTLILNGDAGQTAVKEGTLGGGGTLAYLTVHEGGEVAPGAPLGILSVNESFTMLPGALLKIELNGTDNSNPLAPEYDQVIAGGGSEIAGTLRVTLFDDGTPFAPADGDSFMILSAGEEITGSFSSVNLPELMEGLVWEIDSADGKSLHLAATSTLRSDYNGNGEVDAADYVLWRKHAGQSEGNSPADGTGPGGMPDGVVNEWDYNFWAANFGKRIVSTAMATSHGVPEPSSTLLLAWSGVAILARFRRR